MENNAAEQAMKAEDAESVKDEEVVDAAKPLEDDAAEKDTESKDDSSKK